MTDLNLLSLSIGIGLVVSLFFSEFFGLAAGGLVVPGYIALYLHRPFDVLLTLVAALLTFFLVRVASTFVIVYGRRRTVLMILVGYAVGVLLNGAVGAAFEGVEVLPSLAGAETIPAMPTTTNGALVELRVIGFIVPGLIAIWLDRQGVLPTLAALLTSAVVVRLVLILIAPAELQWLAAQQTSGLGIGGVFP
ncbi:MAG: poly-gamma-glutamate biosynthesis protein PgsC [Deltaproteobacteria bacterium]|nr:MAG: poly-gamma-glutamate biosynthesis protein PgsC [Deltaproteobacteria bacterium]